MQSYNQERAILRYDGKSFRNQVKAQKTTGWLRMRISYFNGSWKRQEDLKCWVLGKSKLATAFREMLSVCQIDATGGKDGDKFWYGKNGDKFWYGKSRSLNCSDLASLTEAIAELRKIGWEVYGDLPPRRSRRLKYYRVLRQQIRKAGVVIDGANVIGEAGKLVDERMLPSRAPVLGSLLEGLVGDKIDSRSIYFDRSCLKWLRFKDVQCRDLIVKMQGTFPREAICIPPKENGAADIKLLNAARGENGMRRFIISNDNFDEYAEEFRWIDEEPTAILNIELTDDGTALEIPALGVRYPVSPKRDYPIRHLWGFFLPERRSDLFLETVKEDIFWPANSFALVGFETKRAIDWINAAADEYCRPLIVCSMKEIYEDKGNPVLDEFQKRLIAEVESLLPPEEREMLPQFEPEDITSFLPAFDSALTRSARRFKAFDSALNRRSEGFNSNDPSFTLVLTDLEQCLRFDLAERADFFGQLLLGLFERKTYPIQIGLVSRVPIRWLEFDTPRGDPTLSEKIRSYELPSSVFKVEDIKRFVPGLDDKIVRRIKALVTSYGGE